MHIAVTHEVGKTSSGFKLNAVFGLTKLSKLRADIAVAGPLGIGGVTFGYGGPRRMREGCILTI